MSLLTLTTINLRTVNITPSLPPSLPFSLSDDDQVIGPEDHKVRIACKMPGDSVIESILYMMDVGHTSIQFTIILDYTHACDPVGQDNRKPDKGLQLP